MRTANRLLGSIALASSLASSLASTPTLAAPPGEPVPARGDEDILLVPYEVFWTALPEGSRGIVLTYAEYGELVAAARKSGAASALLENLRAGVFESAHYSGRVREDRAEIEADLVLRLFSDRPSAARLGLAGAALVSATLDGQPIAVGSDAKGSSVLLASGEGTHRVRLALSVALQPWTPDSGSPGDRLQFNAPRATSATLSLARAGAFEVRSLSPWARPIVRRDGADTRVDVALGGQSPVDLVFTGADATGLAASERALRLGETLTVLADVAALTITATFTVEAATSALEWDVRGLEGARFLSVSGGPVSSFAESGGAVRVRFRDAPRVGDRVVIRGERAIDAGGAAIVTPLAVAGAARTSGSMTIMGTAGVRVSVESSSADGLIEEPASGQRRFRFFGVDARARLRIEPLPTRFHLESETVLRLDEERTALAVSLTATVVDGKLFRLDFPLPAGFRLRSTNPPATRDSDRVSFVWAGGIAAGQRVTVAVELEGDRVSPPPAVDLPLPLPIIAGADRAIAVIAVVADPSLRVEERDLVGMSVRDPQSVRLELVDPGTVALAFRAASADARGTLRVERRPRRASATLLVHHAPTRERIDTEGLISLTVSNEPVESFTLALPAGYTEFLDVESDDGSHPVREKERIPAAPGGAGTAGLKDRFRIGFEGKLRGTTRFRFRFQKRMDSQADSIELPEVEVADVERETGSITIEGADELYLDASTTGLEELDVALAQPLPGYTLRHNLYAAFGYSRHPHAIGLAVRHFPSVAVPPAVVDRAIVRLAVAADGVYEAEACYRLLNSSRQFLEVALPRGASLEAALVAGSPVKPARDRGALLVPVPVNKDATPTEVRLFYEGRIEALGRAGSLVAQAPVLDVFVAEAGFEIFLPHGYRYLSLTEAGRPSKAISDGQPILLRFLAAVLPTRSGSSAGMPPVSSRFDPYFYVGDAESPSAPAPAPVSGEVQTELQAVGYDGGTEGKQRASGTGGAQEQAKSFATNVPRRAKQAGLFSLAIALPEKGVREAFVEAGSVTEVRVSYLGESFERVIFAVIALLQAALSLGLRRLRVARMPVQLVTLGALYTWIPTASIVHLGPGTTLVANALFVGLVGASLFSLGQWLARRRAARIASFGAAVAVLLAASGTLASADDGKAPPKPASVLDGRTVVPFDPSKPRVPGKIDADERVFVPEARFRELWLRAHPDDADVPASFVEGGFLLSDAVYEATWVDDRVEVRATMTLMLVTDRPTAVPLPFTGVALSGVRIDDGVAAVTPAESGFHLYAAGRGAHRVAIEFSAPTHESGSGESRVVTLAFGCPAIAAARMRLNLTGVAGRVEFRNAAGGQSEEAADSTRIVTGFLGDRATVDVMWSVAEAKGREAAASYDARLTARVRLQPGILFLAEDLTLHVPEPGIESIDLDAPSAFAVTAVVGKLVGAIERVAGPDRIRVHFARAASGDVSLRIEGEAAVSVPAAEVVVPLVRPRAPRRLEGTLDVAIDPSLNFEESGDPRNLVRVAADADGSRRYAFSIADVELRARVSVRLAEADVAETLVWSLGSDLRRLDATWRVLSADRGPVTLTVSAPRGFRVASVVGADLVDWAPGGDDASPTLVLRFQKRLAAGAAVSAVWTADAGALPETIAVRPLAVAEARSLRGTLRIDAAEGLATRVAAASGMSPTPVAELREPAPGPGLEPRFGFRFESGREAETSLVVERAVPNVTVETLTLVTVEPHRTFSRIELRYDVTGARVPELTFDMPALPGPQPEVTAAALRRVDVGPEADGKRRYRVVLQAPRSGRIAVAIFVEESREADVPAAPIRVEPVGAEIVARFVALFRGLAPGAHGGAAGELVIDESRGVDEIPVAEVAQHWQVGLAGAERAYRSSADDWTLRYRIVRHAEQKLLEAIVDDYTLTALVLPGSEIRARASFRLQNRTRQYLELTMPSGATLLSAFVDGRPVKAVRRPEARVGSVGDILMLPLRQSSPGEVATTVEVVFAVPTNERREFAIPFPTPRDVPVSATHVKVIGPRGTTLDVEGNLEEIVAAIAAADVLETLLGERARLESVLDRGGEKEKEVARSNLSFNKAQVENAVKQAEAAQQIAQSDVRRRAIPGRRGQIAQSQVESNEVRLGRLAAEARKSVVPPQQAEPRGNFKSATPTTASVADELRETNAREEALRVILEQAQQNRTADSETDAFLSLVEERRDAGAKKPASATEGKEQGRALDDTKAAVEEAMKKLSKDEASRVPGPEGLVDGDNAEVAAKSDLPGDGREFRLKHAVAEDVGRLTGAGRGVQWDVGRFEAGLLPLAVRLPESGSTVSLKKLGGDAVLRVRVSEDDDWGSSGLRIVGLIAGALLVLVVLDRGLRSLGARIRWRRAARAYGS